MATDGTGPPGPGSKPGYRKSWAQLVGSTLPSSWNKNILEVVLEKDDRGAFNVSEIECSHLLSKLGIDPRPGDQVESVQICPTGRGVILITFRQGLNIERFSRYDVIEVTKAGIRAVHVKPAGKRDAVVTIKGLHPNTRDDGVINYLGKYGKIVTNKVVYGTFRDGPLKGIRNGDRSYKMEVNADTNIGTYHAIDGQRVTLRYPGQLQTCARCHETALICKGGAIARKCEAVQGEKVEFSDYITGLWSKIGYIPGDVEMAAVYDEHGDYDVATGEVNQQTGGLFTPAKQVSEPEKFSGVNIKQFPKDTDHGDIMEFIVEAGLPETLKDTVVIRNNGIVTIKNLENAVCLELISKIHNKVQFGKKVFCNGLIALTPEKEKDAVVKEHANDTNSSDEKLDQEPNVSDPLLAPPALSPSGSLPSFTGSHADLSKPLDDDEQFLRRNSLSLPHHPPANSIAFDILNKKSLLSVVSDIKDLKDQLSDFGSCVSEQSGSSSDESERSSIANHKNNPKRKAGKTPIKNDEKSKKANVNWFDLSGGNNFSTQ